MELFPESNPRIIKLNKLYTHITEAIVFPVTQILRSLLQVATLSSGRLAHSFLDASFKTQVLRIVVESLLVPSKSELILASSALVLSNVAHLASEYILTSSKFIEQVLHVYFSKL